MSQRTRRPDPSGSAGTQPASGAIRRCIATGELAPRQMQVRFVAGPDGQLVPDLAAKLPGRGAWVAADRAALARAVDRRLFQRALQQTVAVPADLPALLERLLVERLQGLIGLARRAGAAVAGFEKVRSALAQGGVAVLLTASDAAPEAARKLRAAKDCAAIDLLDSSQLSLPFGRENVIHAALAEGGLARKFLAEASRLARLRGSGARPGDED
ncbi:MAG: RNA-binding protein [Alphaproteobacteria bacterium]|nr:RNA-binding protein [Alphaproteobacteria bacterium]